MNAIALLLELCSVPTAPFAEDLVVQFAERFAAARRRLHLSRDEYGNLLIELGGTSRRKLPRWIFTAHMDHPGFIARRMTDDRTLQALFRGGVRGEFFKGSKVRFFDNGRQITGTVIDFVAKKGGYPESATIRVGRPVSAGAPGMWNLTPGRLTRTKHFSRVCDDLAGAAAALAMLDELCRKPPASPVAVLLTRAEEVGFIGAIAASIRPKLLRKSDRLIAIECSAEQPYARQSDGVIIRVGDRTSIFHCGLTYFLTEQAEALAKSDKTFRFQRALMPGGTCEATVYDLYGFTAAAVCVPLGNYHNMDRTKMKIAPEYVDLRDWRSMVKLFVRIAREGHAYEPGNVALKRRIESRFRKFEDLLGE